MCLYVVKCHHHNRHEAARRTSRVFVVVRSAKQKAADIYNLEKIADVARESRLRG